MYIVTFFGTVKITVVLSLELRGLNNIIQLITFHEVNMVKWRTRDLVLEVDWPDRGRRPRSGQTTESTRSRDLHFTMLAEWKVINCFIIPKKYEVNIHHWPGQYSILTRSIFNIDQVNIYWPGQYTSDRVHIHYWPGQYWILTWSLYAHVTFCWSLP